MMISTMLSSDGFGRRNEILASILPHLRVNHERWWNGTPCIEWTRWTSGNGYKGGKKGRGHSYPRMSLGGVTMAVHRVIYTHFFGIIPHKKQIDHRCNNRLCCNPHHLECVTHLRNQKRRAAKQKENRK